MPKPLPLLQNRGCDGRVQPSEGLFDPAPVLGE